MPPPSTSPDTRSQRHQRILALLQAYAVPSQGALLDLLQAEGFQVNQGTLSRDLRDLQVAKSAQGYQLPQTANGSGGLAPALQQWLLSATPALNQVLLKTPAGGANALALAIDQAIAQAQLPLVLGTIAGDDTVLVICKNANDARRLAQQWELP